MGAGAGLDIAFILIKNPTIQAIFKNIFI